ncbi:MAG: hypothetical protein ACI9U2_004187 [Bradymonadia bacterium]|jgi:hypothetical protein
MRGFAILWIVIATGTALAAPPVVGIVSDLKGTVERRIPPEVEWRAATLDEGLALGDGVQTRAQSAAELTFIDGTVLALGELTRLAVSTLLFEPGHAPPEIRVALQAGAADVHVARLPLILTLPSGETATFAPGTATRVTWQDGALQRAPLPRLLIAPPLLPEDALPPPADLRIDAATPDPNRPLPGDQGSEATRLRIRVRLRGDE